jgi:catechol 2,3-dioxygenase-like lactoylglutathione lyase family enzyme
MKIAALDHVNIETEDVDGTARFYSDILGLESGNRPEFGRPGHWMYSGGAPIIHLITPDPDNKMVTGSHDAAISHFALRIENFEAARAHLDKNGVDYNEVGVPGTPMRQLFFDDPNGVLVELIHVPEGARG